MVWYHIKVQVQRNEKGLLGRSGERGLSALANNSSPESLLGVREIAPMAANPLVLLLFWASCRAEGGKTATGLSDSGPEGLMCELGVGVGLVSGVGMEWMCIRVALRNELNEGTATSGD